MAAADSQPSSRSSSPLSFMTAAESQRPSRSSSRSSFMTADDSQPSSRSSSSVRQQGQPPVLNVGSQGMGQGLGAVGAQGMGQAMSGVAAQGMGQAVGAVGSQGMGQSLGAVGSQGMGQAVNNVRAQGMGQAVGNVTSQGMGQAASAVRVQNLIITGLSRGELPTGTLIQGNIDVSNQRFLLMNLYLNVIFKTLLSNNALKQKYDRSKIKNKSPFVPLVIQEKYMISPPQFYQLEDFPKTKFNDLDVIRKLNDVNLETKINENIFMGAGTTRVTVMKLKENTRINNKKNKFLIKFKHIKTKKQKTIKKKYVILNNIKMNYNMK